MLTPWYNIIQEDEVPEPEFLTLCVLMVLIKERATAAIQNEEFPEEEHREHVHGEEADYSVGIEHEPRYSLHIFPLDHLTKHEIAPNKGSKPEKDVNRMLSAKDYRECPVLHPLLYHFHIL